MRGQVRIGESVSHLDRRQLLRLVGAVAAVGAAGGAAACAPQPTGTELERPNGRTIRIGLITPALGPYAKIGDDIQKGFKLFVADHDNLLGLNKVDLRTAEEGATPESAAAAVKGLLDLGVVALAGLANPAALPSVASALQRARVPLVSSHIAPSALINAFYVWRASHVEGEAGRALAPYARNLGGRAYLLYEDTQTGREEAAAFRTALTDLGGTVVGESSGKVSFPGRMQSADNLRADVIFAAYTGNDATALLDAYRTSGVDARLIGPGSLTETADLAKFGPNLPDRVYTAMYYAADLDNEDNRQFVASYHRAYGVQPSGFAMAAYDSASVLDKALRLVSGPATADNLNQAFSRLGQIQSPRGHWTFNVNRAPQQLWYLRRLRLDGRVAANLLDTELTVLT